MAEKNTVEMIITAKDAVGPGVDAAKKKIADMANFARKEQDKADFAAHVAGERKQEREAKQASQSIDREAKKAQQITATAIKLGAGLAALSAGFTIASAVGSVFAGDMESAAKSLERLPLGIGSVVAGLKGLVGELSGINAELNTLEARAAIGKTLADSQRRQASAGLEGPDKAIRGVSDTLAERLSKLDETAAGEKEKLAKALQAQRELDAETENAFTSGMLKKRKDEAAREVNEAQKNVGISEFTRKQLIRESEAEIAKIKDEARKDQTKKDKEDLDTRQKAIKDAFEESRKEEESMQKEMDEAFKKTKADFEARRLADKAKNDREFNVTDAAAAARFGQAADLRNLLAVDGGANADMDAVTLAIEQARRGNTTPGMAAGQQDRFGTGLVASARESQARVAADSLDVQKRMLEKLDKIKKELEEANKPPAVPGINLEILEGVA